MSRADDLAELERGLLALRGLNNTPITTSKVLAPHETGVLLVDASAGAVTITLPPATRPMDVRVQRIDNSDNRLTVQAASDETVRFHTRLRATGYAFFVLMGAGDFWHLRSDGAGAWLPLDRLDGSALGRPVFETSTAISPGGWGGTQRFTAEPRRMALALGSRPAVRLDRDRGPTRRHGRCLDQWRWRDYVSYARASRRVLAKPG